MTDDTVKSRWIQIDQWTLADDIVLADLQTKDMDPSSSGKISSGEVASVPPAPDMNMAQRVGMRTTGVSDLSPGHGVKWHPDTDFPDLSYAMNRDRDALPRKKKPAVIEIETPMSG